MVLHRRPRTFRFQLKYNILKLVEDVLPECSSIYFEAVESYMEYASNVDYVSVNHDLSKEDKFDETQAGLSILKSMVAPYSGWGFCINIQKFLETYYPSRVDDFLSDSVNIIKEAFEKEAERLNPES
jgi:hypothetical protein